LKILKTQENLHMISVSSIFRMLVWKFNDFCLPNLPSPALLVFSIYPFTFHIFFLPSTRLDLRPASLMRCRSPNIARELPPPAAECGYPFSFSSIATSSLSRLPRRHPILTRMIGREAMVTSQSLHSGGA